MIGKFAITIVFYMVYFFSTELAPTLLRNGLVGIETFCARIGSIIAPYLLFTGKP